MFHHRWRILAITAVLGTLAFIGGISYASSLEQDNRFCVSCHTQPETEFFDRYLRAGAKNKAEDLAAFHHRKKEIRCIDCHVGEGVFGRAQVLTISALDAFKYYTRTYSQPGKIVIPVMNEGCAKCHQEDIRKPGFNNHEHNKLNEPTAPFIACTDCHLSHRVGEEISGFQFRDAILPKCEYCHVQMQRGPRGLVR